MKTARDQFNIGDRVELSAYGKTRLPCLTVTRGEVVNFPRKKTQVAVVLDGRSTPRNFDADCWQQVRG